MRPLLGILVAALLAGCDGDPRTAIRRPATPTQPMSFDQATPDATVSLALPEPVASYPALHQRLLSEGKRELTDFVQRAAADRQRLLAADPQVPPYTRAVVWTVTARTDRLISLRQTWTEYTGGAHGAEGSDTLLWSKGGEAPVLQSSLLRPDADHAALDAMLCDAVKAVKARRMGAVAVGTADWTCPTWNDSRVVLTNSTLPRKAGGLTFLFDPYVLGPYSEGSYEATIPQARFRAALSPDWVAEFDGDPAPPEWPAEP